MGTATPSLLLFTVPMSCYYPPHIHAHALFRSPGEELWKTARKVVFLKNGSPMALRQLPNSTEPSQLSIRIRLLKPHTTNPNETITGYNAAVARSVQPDTSTRNENIAGFNDALASSADLEQPPLAKSASGKGRVRSR